MIDVTTFEDRCEIMLLHVHLLKTLILQEYIFFLMNKEVRMLLPKKELIQVE